MTFYFIDFNNYFQTGTVRELELKKIDPRIRRDGVGCYIFHDDKLGLSRVLYTNKRKAEYVLLLREQD